MMETISIPSPSALLSSPVVAAAPIPPPAPSKRRPSVAAKEKEKEKEKDSQNSLPKKPTGVTKPKQSKSRNGCITCKAKRLKCDEIKPSCQQCHKRNVTCGGYKKDFKWRAFEETTFATKVTGPPVQASKAKQNDPSTLPRPEPEPGPAESIVNSPNGSVTDVVAVAVPAAIEEDDIMQDSFFNAAVPSPAVSQGQESGFSESFSFNPSIPFDMSTPPYLRTNTRRPRFEPDSVTSSLESLFEDTDVAMSSDRRQQLAQSPRLTNLLLPSSENAHPETIQQEEPFDFQFDMSSMLGDDTEEIIRQTQEADDMWLSLRSPVQFENTTGGSPMFERHDPYSRMFRQLEFQAGSPEMLMLRFDKQTCGILSVKDGPTENPWRTLIWPLARDSPALYHAIASMTAFHTSKEKPALRVDGMEHMRQSIRQLATGIEKMRTDTALATTLVLAFSESWDQHISTGIEHLRGARILVTQALAKHNRRPLGGDDLARLRFLCNTWVYMDVIARLTSVDEDAPADFDLVLAPLYGPFGNQSTEIDPLMGCASTLFPLIGRAANLCRRVRSAETNSIAVISQAIELKEKIEQWHAGSDFEDPEDPSSDIQHALQTAEAYRYATLLYLHQAVPEIPSLTSAQLSKKVLVYLATVPLSSRLVIVQIYPLIAAGCEAYEAEDRQWVEARWQSMENRMWIGNIEKCWQVTQEVWRRRDFFEAQKVEEFRVKNCRRGEGMAHSEVNQRKFEEEKVRDDVFSYEALLHGSSGRGGRNPTPRQHIRNASSTSGIPAVPRKKIEAMTTENMDVELTVRGSLHWVGVMKDWEWEVLLG